MSAVLDPARYAAVALPEELPPTLAVVIDTEEEFDWRAPFSRSDHGLRNIAALPRAFDLFAGHGVVPLCVVDYPVAEDRQAAALLRAECEAGRCEIGAHLHTWVTPPFEEPLGTANSYGCNLPPALERRKIACLTERIAERFGAVPTAFRTGRYGVGAATFESLAGLGYRTDLSLPPHSSFARDGGPSFHGWSNAPFWADREGGLLSLPVTTGFSGFFRGQGGRLAPALDRTALRQLRLPGLLSRTGLLERARLTPEGMTLAEMQRLMRALVGDGLRVLTLSFHSSTLLPGATGYARDEADVTAFLSRLEGMLRYFAEELGGQFATVSALDAALRGRMLPFAEP